MMADQATIAYGDSCFYNDTVTENDVLAQACIRVYTCGGGKHGFEIS